MSNTFLNKDQYKTFLIFIKHIPLTIALIFILSTLFNYIGFSIPILSYIGGTSYLFLGLLYFASFVFRFCILHRIPIYYVAIGNSIGILRKYCLFSLSVITMFRIYFILTGIAIIVYIYFLYKNRGNPKVDHIKQLCDPYSKHYNEQKAA